MNKSLIFGQILVAAALVLGPAAHAADSGPATPAAAPVSDLDAARALIKAKDWKGAFDKLNSAVAADPKNADVQNLLGYSYRKTGKLDLAQKHYDEALRLSPDHRGAHEYVGELYLMKDDVAKAERHLGELRRICGTAGCEEFKELSQAIAEYRRKKG